MVEVTPRRGKWPLRNFILFNKREVSRVDGRDCFAPSKGFVSSRGLVTPAACRTFLLANGGPRAAPEKDHEAGLHHDDDQR